VRACDACGARDRRCDRSGNELDERRICTVVYGGFIAYNMQYLHFYVCASIIIITRARASSTPLCDGGAPRLARAMTSTTHARDAQPAVRRAYAVAHGWEHAAALSVEQNASIAQLTSALSTKKDAPEVGVARDARRARDARCVPRCDAFTRVGTCLRMRRLTFCGVIVITFSIGCHSTRGEIVVVVAR
jgi:hypothetical protein